ncbi:alpha-2-macroglobulin [Fibrisoma montanum]|uniref:Alpha-2-macroglobulin n=1 Tax=Fibrisoma montanum TaxID=2305895 RepID=A0A418LYH2_9BACT|nr:alpha-2-macroglobulin family protein [Fibrisoma montanum]RIV18264.1 alpha-2-macroglobulin [Fibrisoma montanum]
MCKFVSTLFILLPILTWAQPSKTLPDYRSEWKKADSLVAAGLPKSALAIANRVYEQARSTKNYPQLAKAAMYRLISRGYTDEEGYVELVRSLSQDIRDTPEPTRSVLSSVLGDLYWQYFQQNRYKFYDRTTVKQGIAQKPTPSKLDASDPRAWDAHKLIEATTAAYLASVRQRDLLQQTPVATYDVLITKGDADSRVLRPTLFDLLAHRAIRFFQNTEPDLLKPIFRFELDQAGYLAAPETFVKLPLQSSDTLSGRFQALQLYQQLVQFHLTDNNPLALADVDALRLAFVHQYSVVPENDSLYHQTLRQQIARFSNQPAEAVYAVALATSLVNLANQYPLASTPRDSSTRWNRKQAAEICRDVMTRYKGRKTAQQAEQLLAVLLQSSYSVEVERVNVPDQPFRAFVQYQNVAQIRYRVVRMSAPEYQTPDGQAETEAGRKEQLNRWRKRKAVAEATVTLPDDGDLNQHSVEIPIAGLPLGQYVLILTSGRKAGDTESDVRVVTFSVSTLSVLEQGQSTQAGDGVFVVDRRTGQPLPGASVQIIHWKRPEAPQYTPLYRTDAQGRARVQKGDIPNQTQYRYRIVLAGDTLLSDAHYHYAGYAQQANDEDRPQLRLFTDRAIYRPGQPIYVKGLLFDGRHNQYRVKANEEVSVTLVDQNGEKVADKTLRTNEFGTFTTTFTAPVGRVTGFMAINSDYGSTSIRVEEYKRPTFEVVAQPIRESFRLGQTVTISAQAKTFSGAVVDRADVRYRVVRRYQQPWWGWWRSEYGGRGGSWPGRSTDETEIVNGVAKTDAQGNVTIQFQAVSDRSKPRSDNPVFDFDVTFDVTDLSGETRSTSKKLRIGYTAVQVDLVIASPVDKEETHAFPLRVTNQLGEPVRTTGEIRVFRLQAPTRLLRSRLWSRPDRHVLSRADYERLFPNDVFDNENDPRSWAKGELVEQQSFTTRTDSTFRPELNRYRSGEYVAEVIIRDSTGQDIRQPTYFSVVDNQQPSAFTQPDAWVRVRKATVEPGQEAILLVGNAQPGWVLMRVEENHAVTRFEWLKTDGKPRRVALPVSEKQRGGFAVHFTMVQNGRLYDHTQVITVPFTNKRLHIETQTFRDKLKPGQPEEWTLTISGPDKDKVLAEMVATLYDASLDQFSALSWPTDLYQPYWASFGTMPTMGFGVAMSRLWMNRPYREPVTVRPRQYDQLSHFGYEFVWGGRRFSTRGNATIRIRGANAQALEEVAVAGYGNGAKKEISGAVARMAAPMADQSLGGGGAAAEKATETAAPKPVVAVVPRRNFNETAFFVPQLQTDRQGRVVLTFTMPEALTRWRLLAFAHTKDLKIGTLEREVVTQKELMITANAPRFLREGDTLRLTARLNNLTTKSLTGTARLELFDALTNEPINQKLGNSAGPLPFTIAGSQSTALGWTLVVPAGLETVTYRLSAQAGDFTDGEEQTLPVLPNRMLVTDTQPFWVNGGNQTKEFKLTALTDQNPELPSQHERLTVEVTSNPAWYALQSLPYLMEYRYECAEQLFSRVYANTLAAHIISSKPAFRQVIDEWKRNPLRNPLQANEKLKAVALENTPWLAQARNEAERQAQLAVLFDQNRMNTELAANVAKLIQLQAPEGGFSWFGGMTPSLTMTLHILGGFGHLQKLGVALPQSVQSDLRSMTEKAIQYVDAELVTWVNEQKKGKPEIQNTYLAVQYLYARSFYPEKPVNNDVLAYLRQQLTTNWLKQSLQGQALTALALHRFGNQPVAQQILKSLTERAKVSDELGMYWPENKSGFSWYETPIETQAYLIEAFEEAGKSQTVADDLRRWLIRQKQTQAWHSTKATTEAVYALLLRGTDWLDTRSTTEVRLGGQPIDSRVTKTEAITGYQKVTYTASEIKPEMGVVQISKKSAGPAWGAVYWQHFEPLDRIPAGNAGLSVQKELYVQTDSPAGPVITPIQSAGPLKPGDLITVRLVLQTDRSMEYVHLKDGRASGFEPVDALSGYRYQNGLGYYESPRDASTDFFLNYLPVGTHVFEYQLRVAHTGDFSAGVATVQCFYAPEFSAHSTGERVKVK